MGRERARKGKHVYLLFAFFVACIFMIEACAAFNKGSTERRPVVSGHREKERPVPSDLQQGEIAFAKGDYSGALRSYKRDLERMPQSADQSLFFIGIIYASPKNEAMDYQKALDALQKVAEDFPHSRYHEESERIIPLLREILHRGKKLQALKAQVETLEEQIKQTKAVDMDVAEKLKTQIQTLEEQIKQMKAVDMDVAEKRRKKM